MVLHYKRVLVYVLIFVGGWLSKGIYLDIQQLTCSDFTTKHAIWKGFISTKGSDVRCFWLEDKYPWRVRQGVPVQ